MAVLTIEGEVLLKVEEFAKQEARPREDVVYEAITAYLKRKAWDRFCESGFSVEGRKVAEQWLTDEDVIQFVDEEIHSKRDEQGNRIRG
ncbi:MAG: hypothetical protein LBU83_06135 [Bacteroidales bacterium]|jgi:predicted transcriptional regulator|nr:hypothetical protein [Bacteroidales bacterium]